MNKLEKWIEKEEKEFINNFFNNFSGFELLTATSTFEIKEEYIRFYESNINKFAGEQLFFKKDFKSFMTDRIKNKNCHIIKNGNSWELTINNGEKDFYVITFKDKN